MLCIRLLISVGLRSDFDALLLHKVLYSSSHLLPASSCGIMLPRNFVYTHPSGLDVIYRMAYFVPFRQVEVGYSNVNVTRSLRFDKMITTSVIPT